MGFPAEYAEKALEAAGGDFHTALEMCMGGDPAAFISDGDQEVGEGRERNMRLIRQTNTSLLCKHAATCSAYVQM